MKKDRNWIFVLLFIIGIVITFVFMLGQTNILYKNSDFTKTVYFYGEEGDSGYLEIQRNHLTPSTAEWVTFGNNETTILFSDEIVSEKLYINLPSTVKSGTYYFNVKANYVSGKEETKEIRFRVN